jgi:hypothetical protein
MPNALCAAVRGKYEHKVGSEDGGELVGGDKTGKKQALDVLARVFVPDLAIDSAGPDGEIAATCSAIQELDIGGNGFQSWEPVQRIAAQLPKLHWLALDRMQLAPLDTLPEGFGDAFGKLRTLCVSGTGMAWEQLLLISGAVPALEEVHFSTNGVTTLAPASGAQITTLARLHSLYLEGNQLRSWDAVQAVGELPELRVLNLNHNQLSAVPKPSGGAPSFPSLCHLMLRGNPIDSWASIDALDGFAKLTEARLAELPLTKDMSGAVARRLVIARLGKLRALNGSEVRVREREDAERFYLRQVKDEYPEGGLPADAVPEEATPDLSAGEGAAAAVDEYGRPLTSAAAGGAPASPASSAAPSLRLPATEEWEALQGRHPRWAALLLHHGVHATKTAGQQASGGVIANELLELTLRATSAEAAHLPAAVRKLPGGLPLKSVKLIACQLFKVEPTKQRMLYTPPGQDGDIPEPLDDDTRSLVDLGVVSGGTVVIDDLD